MGAAQKVLICFTVGLMWSEPTQQPHEAVATKDDVKSIRSDKNNKSPTKTATNGIWELPKNNDDNFRKARSQSSCSIINMQNHPDRDWNEKALSCNCPNNTLPCTRADVVKMNREKLLSLQRKICTPNVEKDIDVVAANYESLRLCSVDLSVDDAYKRHWVKLPLPSYKMKPVGSVQSGIQMCAITTFVFCPEIKDTTTTRSKLLKEDPEQVIYDCILSNWTEWTSCPEDCYDDLNYPPSLPFQSRERHVILAPKSGGLPCENLKESKLCDHIPPCSKICWHSMWSEWSSCMSSMNEHGKLDFLSTREQYIYHYHPSCDSKQFKQSRTCTLESDSQSIDHSKALSLVERNVEDKSDVCVSYSFPSGCTIPCNMGKDKEAVRFILGRDNDWNIQCVKKTACENIPECASERIDNKEKMGKIQNEDDLLSTVATECFVSESRRIGNEWLWKPEGSNEELGSCICADEDAIPCSKEEAYKSLKHWSESILSECKGEAFYSKSSSMVQQTADSIRFLSISGGWRVHCPVSVDNIETAFTFTKFHSNAQIRDFCRSNVDSWSSNYIKYTNYDTAEPECSTAQSLFDADENERCKAMCNDAYKYCKNLDAQNIGQCFYKDCKTGNCSPSFDEFISKCKVDSAIPFGNGYTLCKFVPVDCKFSNWSNWSQCTHKCLDGINSEPDSYRYRYRNIVQPQKYGGKSCRSGFDTGLYERQYCSWLPLCSNTTEVTTNLPPENVLQIIPFENEANTINEYEFETRKDKAVHDVDNVGRNDCEIVNYAIIQENIDDINEEINESVTHFCVYIFIISISKL